MPIIPIKGLFETHLTVSDLEASIAFYRDVVGLPLAHRVPERHAAFHWIGAPGRAMLGLWSLHTSPVRLRLHLAFESAGVSRIKLQTFARKVSAQTLSLFYAQLAELVIIIRAKRGLAVAHKVEGSHA